MSNRVYLYCTNFSHMPSKAEREKFHRSIGHEYEANARIPLYWLFLFSENNIAITNPDDIDTDPDARPYAYLISELPVSLDRLRKRIKLVESMNDSARLELYQQWVDRLSEEKYTHVIVLTEELSWFGEEELTHQLRKSLRLLDQSPTIQDLSDSDEFNQLTRFYGDEYFTEMESVEIVGTCNYQETWPAEFGVKKKYINIPKKKWWHFWTWM